MEYRRQSFHQYFKIYSVSCRSIINWTSWYSKLTLLQPHNSNQDIYDVSWKTFSQRIDIRILSKSNTWPFPPNSLNPYFHLHSFYEDSNQIHLVELKKKIIVFFKSNKSFLNLAISIFLFDTLINFQVPAIFKSEVAPRRHHRQCEVCTVPKNTGPLPRTLFEVDGEIIGSDKRNRTVTQTIH